MADPELLALLETGTRRLVRSVDAMSDDAWAGPSLLPGWSRAHVVAHLALNAEGLAGALEGVHEGRPATMYPSQEARDGDIEELAGADRAELRDRFLGSTTVILERITELADNLLNTPISRIPGAPGFPAGDVVDMRLREVEIHHADLGLGFTAADWPPEFVAILLDTRAALAGGHDGDGDGAAGFTAYAVDLERSWSFGGGGPTVSGPGSALAWWTTGRPLEQLPGGGGLTSDDGRVPRIEAW